MPDLESLPPPETAHSFRGALAPGSRLGRYEVAAVLGQGAFGITYRAHDTAGPRDVAIKEYFPAALALREADSTVLPRSTNVTEEFVWGRARFVDEERTLAKLAGAPAIVRVLDFVEANRTAYMVMELVEGETLEHRLKPDRGMAPDEIDKLLWPLLEGLERVHAEGFLHRDIKPANIVIGADGSPTLIDFGAARMALGGRTRTMTAIFTPGYAPFEQLSSGKQGPYTDIYALGATLYQCVTGRVPINALERSLDDTLQPAVEAGHGAYETALLTGIDAALARRVADRPQTIAEWRTIFETGIAPQAATVVMPREEKAKEEVAQALASRRRRWIAAAAAMILIVGAGGGYLALRPAALQGPTSAEIAAAQKAEVDAAAQRAADGKQRADLESRAKAAEEAQAKAEEARKQAEARQATLEQQQKDREEAQRKAEEETRRKAQQEAKAKADEEARLAAEAADKKKAEAGETALRLSLLDRQHVQVALSAQGFATGSSDGTLGGRSRDMIAAWQKAHNLPPTGFLTAAEQQALMKDSTAAIARFDDDQKKADEEKKKAAEEARKKADEEAKKKAAADKVKPDDQAAASEDTPTAAVNDGAWTLSLSPRSDSSAACRSASRLSLKVVNSYARTQYGPVFVNRNGSVTGTLSVNDGSGNSKQVTLRGSVTGNAGSGTLSGGCDGTFSLSR